jgi:hypothetical protein
MVLHSGPEERLFASISTPGRQEDCVLDGSRAVAVYGYALWPLQRSTDVRAVIGDRLKVPHVSCTWKTLS